MDPKTEDTGSEAKTCENRGGGWSSPSTSQGTPEPNEARKRQERALPESMTLLKP